ncbi:MAG: SLC13 family permease [bacterium]
MSFDFWYTLILILLMSVFLMKEWIETEVVFFAVLMLLIVGNVITIDEAFAGFSNEGMLAIGLLFIVSGALSKTGALTYLNVLFFGEAKTSIMRKLFRSLLPISVISAVMNNTPVVSLFIPAVHSWAEKHHISPSKLFIPISYAAILGGMCTLIGSSTNLVIHGLMIEKGLPGLSFFEISWIGVPIAIIGITFISMVGHYLLPDRKEPMIELGEKTREFVIELKVTHEYKDIGKSIEDAGLRHLTGLFLFQIERAGQIIAPAEPQEEICLDDRLFFTGIPKTILELQKTPGLQLIKESTFDLKQYDSDKIKTFEAVISPSSPLVGQNVRESSFRDKYRAVIIAIHRNGHRIRKKIGDVFFHPGDTLLLLAERKFRMKWYHSNDFYLISSAESIASKPQWQAYFSISVLVLMILLTVSEILPLIASVGLAVLVLVVSRIVSPSDARQMVDWKVLIVIASAFGIAAAVDNSGLAKFVADYLFEVSRSMGVIGGLACIFIITSLYTSLITNTAAAALIFPVAFSVAMEMNVDIRPFVIAVAIAAGASFATPIGYQTNLMVYGPGGYKFKDYLRIGVPLQILVGIIAVFLIYKLYF